MTLNQQDSKEISYHHESFAGACISHGFFTRRGGVSAGIYEGLNCGQGSDDNPDHIKQNRSIVAEHLGASSDDLLSVHQIHSDQCIYVTERWEPDNRPQADAMVTDKAGFALGILTADCAPVLFYGEKSDGVPVIGAAHAGWKGALGGILESTLKAMKELGAQNIKASIGPCIDKRSYEVDESFFERFVQAHESYERFFGAAQKKEHYMFDLAGFCALRLYESGLKEVHIWGLDTYVREDEFFSYRRTTHRQEKEYGRQISAIIIEDK